MKWHIPAIVGTAILAVALPVLAADDTVVKLKNGDMARGTLVELTKNDHVTLQLASGESRTYPWADVESVTPIAAPPPPPPPTVTVAPPPPEPGAMVHLVADDDAARLSKLAGTDSTTAQVGMTQVSLEVEVYDALCRAPCDKQIRPGLYRISGKNLIPSDDFEVPASGAIQVDAHMAGKGRLTGGRFLLWTGIPLLLGGVLTMTIPLWIPSSRDSTTSSLSTMLVGMGAGLAGRWALGLGIGIYLLATASSTVTVTPLPAQGNTVGSFLYRGMALSF